MRKVIAKILYCLFYFKVRKALRKDNVILSIYAHDQKAKPFEEIVVWLIGKGYRFIKPNELYEYLTGKKKINEHLVWLSFDDGWRSNYTDVFPILKKYNIPATIFIATKGIKDGYYWFSRAFQNRESSLFHAVGDLWEMSNFERTNIIKQLPPYIGERITMNEDEITEMTASGLIHWGNHTHDHVMSDKCSNEELKQEIEICNAEIKRITGSSCNFIYSYPNGNLDSRTAGILKNLGFSMAATTDLGFVKSLSDCYSIPRNEFKNGCLEENILQCLGLWTHFFDVVKNLLGISNHK